MKSKTLILGVSLLQLSTAQAAPLTVVAPLIASQPSSLTVSNATPNGNLVLLANTRSAVQNCAGLAPSCIQNLASTKTKTQTADPSGSTVFNFNVPSTTQEICFQVLDSVANELSSPTCEPIFSTPCIDDSLEPNDTPALGTVSGLTTSAPLSICPTNDDYFRYTMTPNQTLKFTARFLSTEGNIDLQLHNTMGGVLVTSTQQASPEIITYTAISNETVALGIRLRTDGGQQAGNLYTLEAEEITNGPGISASSAIDNDGDGYYDTTDCDDNDALVWQTLGCFEDLDGDAHASPSASLTAVCSGSICPSGWAATADDCDDNDPLAWSDTALYEDTDGDSYGLSGATPSVMCVGSTVPPNWSYNDFDCDDSDQGVWELEDLYIDFDLDMFGDANASLTGVCTDGNGATGWSSNATDCDDNNGMVWLLEDLYLDNDLDSFGDQSASLTAVCTDGNSALGWSYTADDCDDNDFDAWMYESLYPDADGDGYGDDTQSTAPTNVCTGGNGLTNWAYTATDCDDNDNTTFPGSFDIPGDGIDQDCSGSDTNYLIDDFENGQDPAVWASVTGDALLNSTYQFSGTYSFNLGGGIGVAETVNLDTSSCSTISWFYMGKRGPETPDSGEFLKLHYYNGSTWVLADSWAAANLTDASFSQRLGKIASTDAFSSSFAVRFTSNGSGVGFDDFFIDDFILTCGDLDTNGNGKIDDQDSDGHPDIFDCDPTNASAWVNTLLYLDNDGDTYGDPTLPATAQCAGSVVPTGYSSNDDDCDDTNSSIHQALTGWPDVDGDLFGDASSTGIDHCGTSLPVDQVNDNTDCDDSNPLINPNASEILNDGIDQDCDGNDLSALSDDFETGTYQSAVWSNNLGDTGISSAYSRNGTYSMRLGGGAGRVDTISIDASSCTTLLWTYYVKKGPEAPDSTDYLTLFALDGTGTKITLDKISGNGSVTTTFAERSGSIPNTVSPASLALRFTSTGSGVGFDDYFIDDLEIVCGSDSDGDGVLTSDDCDDTDPTIWDEVVAYTDADTDGYGAESSLSTLLCVGNTMPSGYSLNNDDCDDNDSTIYHKQVLFIDNDGDTYGDTSLGSQPHCVGSTTPSGYATVDGDCDDTDSNAWLSEIGYLDNDSDGYGDASLGVYNLCTAGVLPQGYSPDGDDCDDSDSSNWYSDSAYVDSDGDGYGDGSLGIMTLCTAGPLPSGYSYDNTDCDDNDSGTWIGTLGYIDSDNDGYGDASSNVTSICGSGSLPTGYVSNNEDCDDSTSSIQPGMAEIDGDSHDQNCDGFDESWAMEDFELGTPDKAIWSTDTGDGTILSTTPYSGAYAYALGGGGASLTTQVFDTTHCHDVMWAYYGQRGPDAPDSGDELYIQYYNGTSWLQTDAWSGNGTVDSDYALRWGIIPDILAFHRYFQFKVMTKTHGSMGQQQFTVDDFIFGCDNGLDEGDGIPTLVDCAPSDPNHWSDCFSCIDLDGDHYGNGCDLGPDCDDNDDTINPDASDVPGDGIDQDCDGMDMSAFFDDFETGTFNSSIWQTPSGDVATNSSHTYGGSWAARMGGGGGTLTTQAFDAAFCTRFRISYWVKRGPETPDSGDNLIMDYRFGSNNWITGETVKGAGTTDLSYKYHNNMVAMTPGGNTDLTVRFRSNGSGSGFDHFFIDDFEIACGN